MFNALTSLYEGKNINKKMTLRTQLKGVKMQMLESIQSYFARVSQIKEQLEAIGDNVEEAKVMMTILNGPPRSWEYFIQGICAKRRITKFVAKEEKLGDDDNQP